MKTAFLQEKLIEQTVYMTPPKEAQTNKVWKLGKCVVYGLEDASRYWYLKFREELIKLGSIPTQLDQDAFLWRKSNKPIGIMACSVDVLWVGNSKFETIINKLKQVYCIGAEHKHIFEYISIKLEQKADFSITITQKDYIDSISPVTWTQGDGKNLKTNLLQTKMTKLRGILAKLNWIAGMTRAEISFFVCKTSTQVKDSTISDLISTKKVVNFVKNTPTYICIPTLHFKSLYIKIFSNGRSQGGFLVFLSDKFKNIAPIAWSSTRCCSIYTYSWNSRSLRWFWYVLLHSVTYQRNYISHTL